VSGMVMVDLCLKVSCWRS